MRAIACIDKVRMAIDQPGRQPPATALDEARGADIARQIGAASYPCNVVAADANGPIAQLTIRRPVGAHRGEMLVRSLGREQQLLYS